MASATLVAISALMLTLGFPIIALAIALYGAGNGIGSVARGTVPLALFGADRYPVLMGRLGFPLLMAMALPPYFGGVAFQRWIRSLWRWPCLPTSGCGVPKI